MYEKYFGLTERPFSIAPDPRFLYMSQQHREALAHLLYGVGEGGGFVQLTGEVHVFDGEGHRVSTSRATFAAAVQ